MSDTNTDRCGVNFPQIWSSFVHAFIDSIHANGNPVAPRPQPADATPLPSKLPPAKRLVAIGDLHGDLHKARQAFRLAGIIDAQDKWIGKDSVVVQVGDILDRGDQELQIFYFLERLKVEAAKAGGAVHVLTGNHETMNVAGQFRYVTPGGYTAFDTWAKVRQVEGALKSLCGLCDSYEKDVLIKALDSKDSSSTRQQTGHTTPLPISNRAVALNPGGEVTRRFLARHPTVLQVGSTLFVHGGLLPQHAEHGIDRINHETQQWMLNGPIKAKPSFLSGRHAVVWAREYSKEDPERCDCDTLQKALSMVPGADRMVVGHTIQTEGINDACDGRVIRVDVGLSEGCGDGDPEVLEILDDKVVRRLAVHEQTGRVVATVLTGKQGVLEHSTLHKMKELLKQLA